MSGGYVFGLPPIQPRVLVVRGILGTLHGVVVAAPPSMGFLVAMYTIDDTSQSMLSLVEFGPAVHSPTLGFLAKAALACAFLEFELVSSRPFLRL